MKANEPITAMRASFLAPETDRVISDALLDQEIDSTDLMFTKFASQGSTSSIYVLTTRNADGKRIDAFFMPVNISFGGYGLWHTSREIRGIHRGTKSATTVRATVWFGSEGFQSKRDIQFTLESRDFLTLTKHALATYTELTGVTLTPCMIIRKAA